MKYLFLAIFIISSSIHLYASFKSNSKLRAQTKGIILLALLGWYCFSVSDPLPIVIAAILTSWLGDVLLIPKGVKWFSAGGISFLISHVCFVAAYAYHVDFSVVPLWLIIAAAVAYIAVTALAFRALAPACCAGTGRRVGRSHCRPASVPPRSACARMAALAEYVRIFRFLRARRAGRLPAARV